MSGKQNKPIVGVTMGDVNGIGPELIIKVLNDPRVLASYIPVVYGSGKAMFYYRNLFKADKSAFQNVPSAQQLNPKRINFVETSPNFDKVDVGTPTPKAGLAAFEALERAATELKEGHLDVLVTLPIDKATIQNDNFKFPGHTEYLTQKFQANDSLMLMVHENLRVTLATGHIPIQSVSQALSTPKLLNKIRLLHHTLKIDFNIQKPKIAVLGLNPHAGDDGLLGAEEKKIIIPAIQTAKQEGVFIMGPYPADGFFAHGTYRKFDGILAMYHDQGLIPFKTLAGGEGVNFTAGLPIIRTSPDHGTAYDIAGRYVADDTSFREAIYLAIDVWKMRSENQSLYNNALGKIAAVEDLVHGEDAVLTDDLAEE